jgi:plastocyanin
MKLSRPTHLVTLAYCIFALAIFMAPLAVGAPPPPITWQATAGSQSTDKGIQALAFLPNELWIHAGDSITWSFPTHEIHTVTFLTQTIKDLQNTTPQQTRPARPGAGGGCPGTTPDGSIFDGSTCVTSGDDLFVDGATYTVTFPTAGNFKLVCLVHNNMTGAVHVLARSEALPYNQASYDKQVQQREAELLSDGAGLKGQGTATAQQSAGDAVTAGIGDIVATGGGSDTVSVMVRLRQ